MEATGIWMSRGLFPAHRVNWAGRVASVRECKYVRLPLRQTVDDFLHFMRKSSELGACG